MQQVAPLQLIDAQVDSKTTRTRYETARPADETARPNDTTTVCCSSGASIKCRPINGMIKRANIN